LSAILRQQRPVRRPDVWMRRAGEENAAFDSETGSVHIMNETALAIWELCDGETQPEEMVEAIVELTGLHPDIVTEDVSRILTDFDFANLITWNKQDAGDQT
jgi:hypothetical protein